MSIRSEGDDIADIRRAIREQKAKLMANLLKVEKETLDEHWTRIEIARKRTTDAEPYLDSGVAADYYMAALEEMASVKAEAEEAIRELVNLLVQDLNVTGTSVASTARVSHTTVNRWLDPERSTTGD